LNQPIDIWRRLISSGDTGEKSVQSLADLYASNRPVNLEVLLNSHCPSQCRHCIYPPDYPVFNANLSAEQWFDICEHAYEKIGLRVFLFNGRHLREKDANLIGRLKKQYPDVSVGVVVSGGISEKTAIALIDANPDWVDVSVDGDEIDHDRQRAEKGSFGRTLQLLEQLQSSDNLEKVNVLTCLTTLNAGSVIRMIKQIHQKGFPNFFITPLTVLDGIRPDPRLRPSRNMLAGFLDDFLEVCQDLDDSWLEFNFFEAAYFKDIMSVRPDLFKTAQKSYDHLEAVYRFGNNECHFSYYPGSLTGIRELVLNSNGDVIPPKVVGMGKIDRKLVFGNMLHDRFDADFNKTISTHSGFGFYCNELKNEQTLLQGVNI